MADPTPDTEPDLTQPTSSSHPDPPDALDPTIDRDIDQELNPTPEPTTMNPTPHHHHHHPPRSSPPPHLPRPPPLEPRIPQKKDATLRDFLSKTDDYAPIIPDAVTDYYLTVAGLPPPPETDRRLARLLALATQKFIADIAADAYQYSRIRSTNTTSNNPLTGLGGAAAFGVGGGGGEEGAGKKGAKDGGGGGKGAPLGGPRAGFGGGGGGQQGGGGRTVLTMEDLGMAVGEYGVNVKRGEFYR